jgi:DNA polymerase-3 subunit epsilon
MASFREATIQRAKQLWEAGPVFLDSETTGLQSTAEIIELCILDQDGSVLFESLVRPRRPVPPEVTGVHGISDAMVRAAPTWLHIWPQVETLLRGRAVGIYNAEFDLRMFQQSHQVNGLPWRPPPMQVFDIMKLYADFTGSLKWQKLEDAGRQCGISLRNTHRAKDDTLLARQLFLYIVNAGARV